MALDRDLIGLVRTLDAFDLRRLLIFVRGLLVARQEEELGRPKGGAPGRITYRQELVRCGRKACGRCPHGPYWYAYWREDGRLRSRYIGKTAPDIRSRQSGTGPEVLPKP